MTLNPIGRGCAFALLAALAGWGAPALAAAPGTNGDILFIRRDGTGIQQLFTIHPDGTGLTQLSFGPTCYSGPEAAPDWSPDGNLIADQHFQSAPNGNCGIWDIDVRNADGTGVTQITSLGDAANPKWSLDGSKILIQRSPSNTGAGFVVMNADGTGQVSLGQFAGYSPSWGPNNKIVYVGATDTCLYLMNGDGTGSAKLANAPCSGANYPDWSPDGSKIVYSLNGGACNGYTSCRDVFVVNADGSGGATQLTLPTPSTSSSPPDGDQPAWSPDGTQIVFTTDNNFGFRVWVMNADGSHQTQLTADGFNSSPRWRPLSAATSLSLPSISGDPLVTSTLTATAGTWSGSTPIVYSYEWRRCDTSGASCAAIASATASTYTLVDADAGATLRVAVTATNGAAAVTAVSNATATIASAAPTITFASRTAANVAGWNNGDVTVTWHCSSPFGTLANVSKTVSTEGAAQGATGTCVDSSGRTASNTVTGINIDKTPPVLTLASRTLANANGWNTAAVTATWSCADALSGTATASLTATVAGEGANQTANTSCTDIAGNVASASASGINIETTPPIASAGASRPPDSAGWYNHAVTFSFSATSLAGAITCDAPKAYAGADSAVAAVKGACTDAAGLTGAASASFKYDASPPVLSGVTARVVAIARGAGVKVDFEVPDAADLLAGVVPVVCTPRPGSTFAVGDTTVSCSATDGHGNTATASFVVHVDAADTVAGAHGCSSSPGGTLPLALALPFLFLKRRRRGAA